MKTIITTTLLTLCCLSSHANAQVTNPEVKPKPEQTTEPTADAIPKNKKGELLLDDVADHVKALVKMIEATDMTPLLLSENKLTNWLIQNMQVVEANLVRVEFSDGHSVESVLFDYDPEKHWHIIRRSSAGDWKPKADRQGDRLTIIAFPPAVKK